MGKVHRDTESRAFDDGVYCAPGQPIHADTHEQLQLPSHVLALFQPAPHLSLRGVQVLLPSYVDPGYTGHVEVVLCSLTEVVNIEYESELGRLLFFDISTTFDENPGFEPEIVASKLSQAMADE